MSSRDEAPRIPVAALGRMAGWRRMVVWRFLPQVTTWRLVAPDGEVRYLKVSQLGQRASLADERDRMTWAAAWLPVPRVIEQGSDGYDEWLLTTGLPGVNAVDDALRVDPARLVPLLAEGLRWFHTLPVAGCPFDGRSGLDHRPPGDALRRDQPAGGHLAQAAEDRFELAVEVLQRMGAQLVEDAADLDAGVGVRVRPAPGRHQDPVVGGAPLVQIGVVVMDVAEHE